MRDMYRLLTASDRPTGDTCHAFVSAALASSDDASFRSSWDTFSSRLSLVDCASLAACAACLCVCVCVCVRAYVSGAAGYACAFGRVCVRASE